MNRIEIELPIDSVNGLERKLKHTQLVITESLEMSHRAKVEYYKGGILIDDVIDSDILTPTQKQQRKQMYSNIQYGNNTEGAFVDPKTGAEILPGPSGYDESIPKITELEFWQSIPSAFFTAQNLQSIAPGHEWREGKLLSELVYNAIQFSMLKMVERERV